MAKIVFNKELNYNILKAEENDIFYFENSVILTFNGIGADCSLCKFFDKNTFCNERLIDKKRISCDTNLIFIDITDKL